MKFDTELQRFAVAVYRADGVSAACLTLQDRFDVDVNVMLFAAYIGAVRGRTLSESELVALHTRVDPWHRHIVGGLRSVRSQLRSGPAPAPDARTDTLREKVKALEVEAELIELGELDSFAATLEFPAAASGDAAERAAAAMAAVIGESELTIGDRDVIGTVATAAAQVGVVR